MSHWKASIHQRRYKDCLCCEVFCFLIKRTEVGSLLGEPVNNISLAQLWENSEYKIRELNTNTKPQHTRYKYKTKAGY